ncbi:alpha/beta hydrolase [Streptomyces sp. NPDC060194]|uniref:alpha/beta hydrolase n=1 Tax=Streptomyces sp. NPDC060194 TaxID=3347069 RepID=UPI00364AA5B6
MHLRRPSPRPPRPARPLRTAGTVLAAALALLAVGCTAGGAPAGDGGSTSARTADATPAALAPYYAQRLTWSACRAGDDGGGAVPGFECARLKVPLDYADPGRGDIRLAVSRAKATGPGARTGSLLVNPGGPGGSAVGYLQAYAGLGYPADVRARYDMVAVDPRGVAASEPVRCLDGKEMDAFVRVDQTPDDRRETDRLVTAFEDFARACGERSARILPHVSTVESARDMDVLRAALGDRKLTYVGASYGTFLGATYAELFPARVGRLVLDGALDPSISADELGADQTAGFQTAFAAFTEDCVARDDCPLGTGTPGAASRRLAAFFSATDAEPLATGGPRTLTESLATIGVLAAMYDENAWPLLREALADALGDGDGAQLLALADTYYERDPDGSYANLMAANPAVNCLDGPPAFDGPQAVEKMLPTYLRASPVFGAGLAWASMNCAAWPVKPTGTPHPIAAPGAAPILVVGTTRDPATPYKWSKALASQLDSGRLLTYDGDGHTAYGRGSACIDSAINAYLLKGTLPPVGTTCR